jgi:serine/threonine-protein kinase
MATRKIAGYTITREHARGGMGTVYQALSPEGAMVAIKTVLWPESVDPRTRWEAIERFQREARAASSLSHPNICQVLDFGADEDSLYIVMEFLEGNTVRQLIGDAGAIKVDRAVEIVSSVGEALAHAHDQGIIHRDVKPENIMILRGGQAKLTDFGLASVASQQTMTMPGTTMGTMSYMSPEQVRGEKVDARSDIFSLGATFYEMLTGVRAFQAEEPAGVVNQILNTDPPPIAGVPANISEAVAKCLHKAPGERYQSTREMLAALKTRATDVAPSAIAAVPTPRPEAARGRRGLRRVLRRWRVVAAVVAVLAIGGLVLLRPWTRLGGEPATTEVTEEAPARPKPPPPLNTPQAEEADVGLRANFHFPEDKEFTEGREWFEWFVVGPSETGVTAVEGDALVLEGAPPREAGYGLWTDFLGASLVSEFVMEARITKLEGPDDWPFGFAFHAGHVDAYMFMLCANGDVTIAKMARGELSWPAWVRGAPEVNQGSDAENRLKVVRRHGRLHVFVNDQRVLTTDDFELGAMTLALVTRSGARVAFSDIRVEGISVRKLLYEVDTHMKRAEMREAREKLVYLSPYAPNAAVENRMKRAQASFDRRATVLVVIPSKTGRGSYDTGLAERLVAKIEEKGAGREFHFAAYVTDAEVIADETYREFPLITLEPPDWNKWADELKKSRLPRDDVFSSDEISIHHDIGGGDRRVALWGSYGDGGTRTAEAVDKFISSGLLDEYLEKIWEEE